MAKVAAFHSVKQTVYLGQRILVALISIGMVAKDLFSHRFINKVVDLESLTQAII